MDFMYERMPTIDEMISRHRRYLHQYDNGEYPSLAVRADFSGMTIMNRSMSDCDLRYAIFDNATLINVTFGNSDLSGCSFENSNIKNVRFGGCLFTNVLLDNARIIRCSFDSVDLSNIVSNGCPGYTGEQKVFIRDCDFSTAKIPKDSFIYYTTLIVPEEGSFIGWKRCGKYIIKLLIPEDTQRSNGTNRKCRCSKAMVLDIQNLDGSDANMDECIHYPVRGPITTYKKGEMVYPDSFDENRWNECSHGIHFFITRQEAVDYQ